jgi:hypothetical protein
VLCKYINKLLEVYVNDWIVDSLLKDHATTIRLMLDM